ncbi:MAG: Glucose-6-phosphate isomerase [Candidatus Parcubacteria bacterium]|jgi:glucose-6-phosphate isomerase
MRLSFYDSETASPTAIQKEVKKLKSYREHIATVADKCDATAPEYSLVYATDEKLHETLRDIKKQYAKVKHVVLIGIGGSSLGLEAVHNVLDSGTVELSVLDTVSAYEIDQLLTSLKDVKKAEQLVVCVVSKSGGTTETLVNAGIVLDTLVKQWGSKVYGQTIFIGDDKTDFMKAGKKLGVTCVAMPHVIGGRYSVATEVGLVPLALLGHDVDAFIEGFSDASSEEYEQVTAESAARLALYIGKGHRHYNFFAFEKRLASLGAWYRQLFAESIGKSEDKSGKPFKKGFLPTVSTPVELHSIGQLYLSGFEGVYTDFVTFDDEVLDFAVPKQGVAKKFSRFTAQEISTALYGGVVAAYSEKQLANRATIFDESLAYSLGLFMAMRMRETMYVAHLLNLNAFDQPNVELYKVKTKAILGL